MRHKPVPQRATTFAIPQADFAAVWPAAVQSVFSRRRLLSSCFTLRAALLAGLPFRVILSIFRLKKPRLGLGGYHRRHSLYSLTLPVWCLLLIAAVVLSASVKYNMTLLFATLPLWQWIQTRRKVRLPAAAEVEFTNEKTIVDSLGDMLTLRLTEYLPLEQPVGLGYPPDSRPHSRSWPSRTRGTLQASSFSAPFLCNDKTMTSTDVVFVSVCMLTTEYIFYCKRAIIFLSSSKILTPPSPSPPSQCVLPPHQRRGVHTRRKRGGGGQYFGRRQPLDLPLTV